MRVQTLSLVWPPTLVHSHRLSSALINFGTRSKFRWELMRVQTLTFVWLPTLMYFHRLSKALINIEHVQNFDGSWWEFKLSLVWPPNIMHCHWLLSALVNFGHIQVSTRANERFTRLLGGCCQLLGTLILVWLAQGIWTELSSNSRTTLIFVWPRAWELNKTFIQLLYNEVREQNSHPTLSHYRFTTRMRVEQNSLPILSHYRFTTRMRLEQNSSNSLRDRSEIIWGGGGGGGSDTFQRRSQKILTLT